MITCTISGCKEMESENLSSPDILKHWIILRACRCGAWAANFGNPKSCTCRSEGPVPISYWPHLDWWKFGGVDEITLCPAHKLEVMEDIIRQRGDDPSMNSQKFNRGNRH